MLGRKRRVMDEMNTLDQAAGAIIGLGALNWGLVGLANFDAIRATFGRSRAARAVTRVFVFGATIDCAREKLDVPKQVRKIKNQASRITTVISAFFEKNKPGFF